MACHVRATVNARKPKPAAPAVKTSTVPKIMWKSTAEMNAGVTAANALATQRAHPRDRTKARAFLDMGNFVATYCTVRMRSTNRATKNSAWKIMAGSYAFGDTR